MLERPLHIQRNTTQDWLMARASATPNRPFLYMTDRDDPMTFAHMEQQVNRMMSQWMQVGIQRGDHVAMLMLNFPLTVVQVLVAMRMGVTLVPLNTRLTVDELDFQLRQADCRWVLPYGTADVLSSLRDCGHHIVPLDTIQAVKLAQVVPAFSLDDPLAIIHTSGTSGRPKGAVLTYNNIYQSAMASAYRIGVLPDDRWLCVLPLFHVGGLSIILRSLLYGTAVEMMPSLKFDVDEVNRILTEKPITLVSLVPTMLQRLLDARTQAWHPSLRLVLLGGAAPSPQLVQRCVDEGIPIATTYGLSEASSQVATSTPQSVIQKPASVGKPLMFTQVRVVDAHGHDAPIGDIGELLVKSPTVMQGYYKNAEATSKTLRDGWLHTGDMGYKDADGDLFIVQRRSDLIVTGGENVYPVEVENAIRQHPAVQEVVVVGIDDDEWGQQVAAAVQLADGQMVSADELVAFAREHLAGYKLPRQIQFVQDFPQTGSGKIQRKDVRMFFDER
jgi:O-succinylbenzoic acid--CoA ligase